MPWPAVGMDEQKNLFFSLLGLLFLFYMYIIYRQSFKGCFYPPVAQLDRVSDSDSGGQGFESLRAGQKNSSHKSESCFFVGRDSNPERVSGVKKTCLRHVFSREV